MTNIRPEIFRPSSRVRLSLRFEEYDDTGALIGRLPVLQPGAAPTVAPQQGDAPAAAPATSVEELNAQLAEIDEALNLEESQLEPSPAVIQEYRNQRARLTRQLGQATSSIGGDAARAERAGTAAPLDYTAGPSPDDRFITVEFVPVSVSIERNGLRTADTATVTLDFRDVPVDARLVRSAAIEIYLGVVNPIDFEEGMRNGRSPDGSLSSLVNQDSRLVTHFFGVVDDWKTALDESGGDLVTISCRDYSALLLDTPVATGTAIDLTKPIDQGIQDFLRLYPTLGATPQGQGIEVFYGSPFEENAGPVPVPAHAAPASTAPRRGRGARQARGGDQNTNLWDVVTDTCVRVGLVPLFFDYHLRLIDPRTFYTNRDRPTRMLYGQNLRHFEASRKLGGTRVPTIEVRCWDPDIGRTRWARYPVPDGADASASAGIFGVSDPPSRPYRANVVSVSGWSPENRIQTYVVQGVTDPDVLRRVARSTFEQIGRQEIEGNFQTDVVTSSSALFSRQGILRADNADLLLAQSGDAVEVLVSGVPGTSRSAAGLSASEIASMEVQRRADYLVSIGWRREVADRFSRFAQAASFQTVFRVQNVRLEMDADVGLTVNVDFINYIVVREEAQTNPDSGVAPDVGDAASVLAGIDLTGLSDTSATGVDALREAQNLRDVSTQQRALGTISQEQYERQQAAASEIAEVAYDAGET